MPRIPHLCRPVLKYHLLILAGAVLLTVAGAYYATKLKLDSDMAALLPDSYESVKALRRMEGEVGGTSQLRVALKSHDFQAMERLADHLATVLEKSEYVGSVDYRNDVEFYEKHAMLFLEPATLDSIYDAVQGAIDREKQKVNPFMVDDLFGTPAETTSSEDDLSVWEEKYSSDLPSRYYLNPDSTVLVLSVNPASQGANLSYRRSMVADVRRIVTEAQPTSWAPDMEVFYGGNIKNSIDELETITRDILGTAAWGVTGVFLLLVVFFRRIVIPILLSICLFASLTWTFGLTYLLVGQLNTITGFLFVVLFGMGIDVGVHAAARYIESRQVGLSREESIDRMVCKTGKALATSTFTTSAAFFSLVILQFKGFSELGLIVAIGMVFAFLAMVIVLPSLVILVERLRILKIKPVPGKRMSGQGKPMPWARTIVAASAVLTLLMAFFFTEVSFQYDFTDLRIITQEREEYARETTGVFSRSESPAIVLADSREAVQETVDAVKEKMRTDTLSPTIQSVRSILSVIPANQEVKLQKIRTLRELVKDEADGQVSAADQRRVDRLMGFLAIDQPFSWADFPAKDREQFTNQKGEPGNFVMIYPSVALRDGRNAMAFRDDVGTIVTKSGKMYHAGSSNIIVADLLSMIEMEGPIAVALSLLVVFLIVLLDFRNLRAALFVMTPLTLGIVWMGGMMHVVGMQLNFFNIVVFPSVIGIGVDDGVHIYHRYLEEGRTSIPFVLQRTGMAVVLTTVTTVAGYSGLLTAHHPGLQSIGKLAVIGLTATLITAAIVFPAVLQVFDARPAALPVQEQA